MPDSLELLKQFVEEADERFLKKLPAEKRLEGLSPDERLRGLSPDELLAALSPEMRAALAQRLKENGSPTNPEAKEPGHGDSKP